MSPKADNKPRVSGTDLVHADDHVPHGLEVAPHIAVSTSKCLNQRNSIKTYIHRVAYKNPKPWTPENGLDKLDAWNPPYHVYSRYTQGTSTRAERVLSKINVSEQGLEELRTLLT